MIEELKKLLAETGAIRSYASPVNSGFFYFLQIVCLFRIL